MGSPGLVGSTEWSTIAMSIQPPTYEPVPLWGKIPHGITFRGSATSVAVGAEDRVYVFNRGNYPLLVFDPDGNLLDYSQVNDYGRPHSITIDSGAMFLVDDGAHFIEKRTLDGELLFELGVRDKPVPRHSGGMFNRPTAVAVHPLTRELFVSDGYANSRVHRFSPDGKHLLSWGEPGSRPGQFSLPHSIVVTSDDRVLVCDRENFRVQVFSVDGKFLDLWHLHRPAAITMSAEPSPLFFVCEHTPHPIQKGVPNLGGCIRVLDYEGSELTRFGGELPGHEPGQFMEPHSIAVDSRGDVYVAEVCNSWVANLGAPPPLGEWPSLRKWRRVED
jgi:hypothetical protein